MSNNTTRLFHEQFNHRHRHVGFLRRQGDQLTLPGSRMGAQTLKVLELNAREIRIEVAPLNRVLVFY